MAWSITRKANFLGRTMIECRQSRVCRLFCQFHSCTHIIFFLYREHRDSGLLLCISFMPWPIWLAAWGVKHIAVYQAGALYGFPRIYRRALEYSVRLNGAGSRTDVVVRESTKRLFRSPANALNEIEKNTGLLHFFAKVEDDIVKRGPSVRGWWSCFVP
jgi:hypothetical protein